MFDAQSARVESGGASFTCVHCGALQRVALASTNETYAAPRATSVTLVSELGASNVVSALPPAAVALERARASAQRPLEIPETNCPKCLTLRGDGPSCRACGLTFGSVPTAYLDPPAWLEAAWKDLLLVWGNDARHALVRESAANSGVLADLGRLYRIRLVDYPDDPYAAKGLHEILRTVSAVAQFSPRKPPGGTLKIVLTVLALVLSLVLLFMLVPRLLAR